MSKIDISYASKSEHNFAQRLVIKTIENVTGKRKLLNLYKNYLKDPKKPINFWTEVLRLMDIKVTNKSLIPLHIPKSGPLIVIANHPFGIIDGLILCSLVSKIRGDFKIMTHETLKFLPELEKYILPVDFSNNKKETIKYNLETAKKAHRHLLDKGILIIFPSGSVSIAENLKAEAKDNVWKNFPAKLIQQTKSDVLPIYFDGKNGILFHLFASKLKSQTLKYSSYLHETRRKIGKTINIFCGEVILNKKLKLIDDKKQITLMLRDITMSLSVKR